MEWIILLTIIALLFYIAIPVETQKKVFIPKGSTSESIISQLALDGYNVGRIDQRILAQLGRIKSGEVRFKTASLQRLDFLYRLTQAKAVLRKITLIPGETTEVFLSQVARRLDINETKLRDAYKKYAKYPEAAIAADTYHVPKKIDEERLIRFLLKSSERRYETMAKAHYGDYNRTQWQRILTIASIIQKETADKMEMPLISSVIQNRLAKEMPLQMDGTLNYGKYSHVKVTPDRIRDDNTTFNTYKHKGLPDSPVASVSTAAIEAAIQPAKTSYLYFMRNKKTGRHDFAKSFKVHRQNIRKVQRHRKFKSHP